MLQDEVEAGRLHAAAAGRDRFAVARPSATLYFIVAIVAAGHYALLLALHLRASTSAGLGRRTTRRTTRAA
jgi:hypothetical protein